MPLERGSPSPWDARAADLPATLTDSALAELLDGSDEEVLRRLHEGDPLSLRGVLMARQREEGYLLDPDRLLTRVTARVVFESNKLGDVRKLRRWLYRAVPKAQRELLREDSEADRAGVQEEGALERDHGWLSKLLRIEPAVARTASVAFNQLPKSIRSAFFDVVLLRRPAAQHAEGNGIGVGEVQQRIQLAAIAISRATGAGGPEGVS